MGSAPKPVLQHAELTEKIIGAFYCVYNDLGPGFLESVYKRSMAIALADLGLKIEVEHPVPVSFRGQIVGDFRTDIPVEDRVLLELLAGDVSPNFICLEQRNAQRTTPIAGGKAWRGDPARCAPTPSRTMV